jgi:hypothetical protein
VYFASWKPPNQSKEAKAEPIGYFYFLDGGFRWDSLISFPKIRISNAKIVRANSSRKWNLFTLQMQLLNTSPGLCACTT